jgi:PITH domain
VDFADAEQTKPQLNISLLEGAVGVTEYPLRSAAFANIHSLSLFFVRNISTTFYICFQWSNYIPRAKQWEEK